MKNISDIANPWIANLAIYEPGKPIEEVARELGLEPGEIAKMASNENALGPSPLAMQSMERAVPGMHRYPDGGAFHLRDAIARDFGVDPGQVVVGNGSNELLELVGHVFLGPGRGVVCSDRAFIVYRLVAAMYRAGLTVVPMDGFTHDLRAMSGAITDDTRVVFVSNPNNPTGTAVANSELDRFVSELPGHVVAVIDEAYTELIDPAERPNSPGYIRSGANVIITRTFSKAYGLAGLRIGYAVASEECAKLLQRVRQPFNANAMAQTAALAALQDDDHVARTREMVWTGLQYFERELRAMELEFVPSVVNFFLVKVGNGRRVFEEMQRLGVIVRPMDVYGLPEYIRVTVGTPEENKLCLEALGRVMS